MLSTFLTSEEFQCHVCFPLRRAAQAVCTEFASATLAHLPNTAVDQRGAAVVVAPNQVYMEVGVVTVTAVDLVQ